MNDEKEFNGYSGLDDDDFMKIPDFVTDLPFFQHEENDSTPWYKDMIGSEVLTFRFGHYKMQTLQWESGPFVWNELNWFLIDIDESKGQALLLADKCVALDFFNGKGEMSQNDGLSAWEKSDVREFLNGKFYEEAFNEGEKKLIISRNKYNDRIFLLNIEEIKEKFRYENLRCGEIYYVDDISGRMEVWLEPVSWWVDTEGEETDHMCVVSADGRIDKYGREMDADETGIRPAMWIDLRKLVEYRKCKKGMAFAKLIAE